MKVLSVLLLLCLGLISNQSFSQKNAPKVVVGIVVDQMCYDYLYRFYPQFGKDGFKRLMDKGTHFRNVTYNYVPTFTGPGHASIYTGTTPSNHGIVANEWFYRPFGREVNCVEDTTVSTVGSASSYGKCSPYFLRSNTITDQLKLTYPSSKVIGVSIKDRSAILPAGHLSDGSYWYDYATGNFITSTFYKKQLPQWVNRFNELLLVSKYVNQPWNLLKDSACYTYIQQDNSPYEGLVGGKTSPVFPYDFSKATPADQLSLFTIMPAANTFLTDFAIQALSNEQLGKHATTDFLTISYSTPDIAGHTFGPYSLEMEDMYFRLDQELARLFQTLDKQIGKGEYVVFLTADHAVVPVPQFLKDHQLPGGYLFLKDKIDALRTACVATFGKDYLNTIENDNVYLTNEILGSELEPQVISFFKTEISKWTEVKRVYTKGELETQTTENWQQMVASGYDKERSGELIFILQPGYLPKSSDTPGSHKGTSHGSAFNYDTHVPVLFYGKDILPQDVFTPYEIVDITATLVHILEVQRPNTTIGKPMLELFKTR
ncbi:alkaline phosphatase family protein [Fluviicola taffensis]|uniref:Type I phosphodiesterase/nucleotide pyrophosphatase n=1 Tax=Fluviicola taffensis (strain DSM 16823 / NCIMB 13979 / RW262) TaxID=755732 RepID=F2IE48_FLUTR|nr:alkaline phosphatase family protein [Fluviicola taffensis]AEA42366.1 type I phosphodiesterase/nucleotide pyrophosphatase [Fluviicola taffensis DSM 16823]